MSRPVNPSYTLPTWADDSNYSAGSEAWSGTATKVAPLTRLWTPNTKPPAQYFNYVLDQAFDTDAAAKAYQQTMMDFVGQMQAMNWPARTINDVNYSYGPAAVWNSWYKNWVISANDDPLNNHDATISISYDGRTWQAGSAFPGKGDIGAICVNPTNGRLVAVSDSATNGGKLSARSAGGGSWTQSGTANTGDNATECLHYFNSRIIFMGREGGTNGVILVSTDDGDNWAAYSGTYPTAAASGYKFFNAADDGTTFVSFPRDPSTTSNDKFMYSTDGHNFSVGTMPEAVNVQAVAYSSLTGKFMALSSVNSGATKVFTSSDGVTWTKVFTAGAVVGGIDSAAYPWRALTCCGSLWVALEKTDGRVWFSYDDGVTWKLSTFNYKDDAGNTATERAAMVVPTRNYLASNGHQMLLTTRANLWASLSMGLPSVSVTG